MASLAVQSTTSCAGASGDVDDAVGVALGAAEWVGGKPAAALFQRQDLVQQLVVQFTVKRHNGAVAVADRGQAQRSAEFERVHPSLVHDLTQQ